MPFSTLRHADQFHPRMFSRILSHDLISAVGRTIADDDPFERADGLRHNGSYGQFDELSLVPCGGDENIGRKGQHAPVPTAEVRWGASLLAAKADSHRSPDRSE